MIKTTITLKRKHIDTPFFDSADSDFGLFWLEDYKIPKQTSFTISEDALTYTVVVTMSNDSFIKMKILRDRFAGYFARETQRRQACSIETTYFEEHI